MLKGEKIQLKTQSPEIVECEKCSHLMVNLDSDDLWHGDLTLLKKAGVRISNPDTQKEICVNCEYETIGHRISRFFESDNDDDDDSGFFSSAGSFLGGRSSGGFSSGFSGGGFGGFGGGSFGGGGVSRGF